MGRTLLRAELISRNPRRFLPCKRFCCCCGEDSIKPSRLKCSKSLLRKREARKRGSVFSKKLKVSGRVSIQVNPQANTHKSVCKFDLGVGTASALLKQVTVNITRLSQNVVDVLSENGSICISSNNAENTINLRSSSKSLGDSCLVTPTRRLRSTLVQPFVRRNVMDRLRDLNSDWRSTSFPLIENLPAFSEALDNSQNSEFSMKTLFLENLSICKKTPPDEGTKENDKMPQNENRVPLLYQDQNQFENRSSLTSSPRSKVHVSPYQTLKSISSLTQSLSHQAVPMTTYRSLLRDPSKKSPPRERLAMKSIAHQNFRSLLFSVPEERAQLLARKKGASIPSVPLKPPLLPIKPAGAMPKRLEINSKEHEKNKIEATHYSLIDECALNKVPPTSTVNSVTQNEKWFNASKTISPSKSKPKPNILETKSKQIRGKEMQAGKKFVNEGCFPKNSVLQTKSNSTSPSETPRRSRRKQTMQVRSVDCNNDSLETDSRSLPLESVKRTDVTAISGDEDLYKPCVGSGSACKKPRIDPETSVSSSLTVPSYSQDTKQQNSGEAASQERQGEDHVCTIVVADSSEDEHGPINVLPAKSTAAKGKSTEEKLTPVQRFGHKKSVNKKSLKTTPIKGSKTDFSKGRKDNPRRTSVAVNRVLGKRNSSVNKNSRHLHQNTMGAVRNTLGSDSDSNELSSDSEENTPRYVSRTGRVIGVSSGCRSCPGCIVDVPRNGKRTPMPSRKKLKRERNLPCPPEGGIVSWCDPFKGIPEAPHTVIIHGLTSSESSDEEFMDAMKRDNEALVVVVDDGCGGSEVAQPRDGVSEEVTEATSRPAPKTIIAVNPAETISELQGNGVGPGTSGHTRGSYWTNADIPVRSSEHSAKFSGDDSANLILQNPESEGPENLLSPHWVSNNNELPKLVSLKGEPVYPDLKLDDNAIDRGSSCAHVSELQETLNPTDVTESVILPHLASCHEQGFNYDSIEKPMHGINYESSKNYIAYLNAKSESQRNEPSKHSVSHPSLADYSTETSGSSSSIENYNFTEYTKCESTSSSLTSPKPEGSSRGINTKSESEQIHCNNAHNSIVNNSYLGDESKLFNPKLLRANEHPKKEGESHEFQLSQVVLKAPSSLTKNNIDGQHPCNTQITEVAPAHQNHCTDLASELPGQVPPTVGTEICFETSGHLSVSPESMSASGDSERLRNIHPSKSFLENTFHLNSRQDASPLGKSASEGKLLLHEFQSGAQECSPVTEVVSNHPVETLEDVSSILDPSNQSQLRDTLHPPQQDDINEPLASVSRGSGREDCVSQDMFTAENLHSSLDDSTSQRGSMLFDNQPAHGKCDTSTPNINVPHDSQEEACISELVFHNDATGIVCATQDYQMFHRNAKFLEIILLNGCPSCLDEVSPEKSVSSTYNHPVQGSSTKNLTEFLKEGPHDQRYRKSFTSSSSENGAESKAQESMFYRAIANLLVRCLNTEVNVVKLGNRDFIIKKVDHEPAEIAPKMDLVDQEASVEAKDIASVVQELDLPVSLNPRLLIKKLPCKPQKDDSFFETVSASGTLQDKKGGAFEDHQVPENTYATSTTPTKSFYERKGYPSPIKRIDPRVLLVTKYNDIEIYSDEPSLNDPPKSDRVECTSSSGIRFELKPGELADLENLLNGIQDRSLRSSVQGEAPAMTAEIDELVFYNDEPPLNTANVKPLDYPPLIEDLEDLIIDNDSPSLNEPAESRADCCKTSLNDSECMVISSDDEVMMDSGTCVKSSLLEVVSGRKTVPDVPSKPIAKPRKKVLRKKPNAQNLLKAPSIIDLQRSQMELLQRKDPGEYLEGRHSYVLDVSDLECTSDDIIEEISSGVETTNQSLSPFPPLQNCREVIHQPQVFNHQGQAILKLDALGHLIGRNPPNAKSVKEAAGSFKKFLSASHVTFDLSETFRDPTNYESFHITNIDSPTASECDDELVMISTPKTSYPSNLNRNLTAYSNDCDKKTVVVHSVDTDSDDDVIVMCSPDNIHGLNL